MDLNSKPGETYVPETVCSFQLYRAVTDVHRSSSCKGHQLKMSSELLETTKTVHCEMGFLDFGAILTFFFS